MLVAPSPAACGPAAYGTSGRRCASTSSRGVRNPRDSTVYPAAAYPTRPASATTSPGRAPSRRTGSRPPRSPSAVTEMTSTGPLDMSPPTIPAPASAASSASPSASSSAQATFRSAGAQRPTSRAVGTAPMAATSARLAAAARCPTSAAADQSRRKCRPSTSTSVVATTRPSGAATTAASSPGPSSAAFAPASRATTRRINPNSPVSEMVGSTTGTSCLLIVHPLCTPPYVRTLLCGSFTGDPARLPQRGGRVVVQAYILIQTEVGKARDVAAAITDIPGVVRVDAVTGPYDVIVLTEAHSVDELGKMIVSKVQLVSGITRTLTCSVVRL